MFLFQLLLIEIIALLLIFIIENKPHFDLHTTCGYKKHLVNEFGIDLSDVFNNLDELIEVFMVVGCKVSCLFL